MKKLKYDLEIIAQDSILQKEKYEELVESLDKYIKPNSPLFNIYNNTKSKYEKTQRKEYQATTSHRDRMIPLSKIRNTFYAIINALSLADMEEGENKSVEEILEDSIHFIQKKISDSGKVSFENKIIELSDFEQELEKYSKLIFIDMDDFSIINKEYGIQTAKDVINEIQEILKEYIQDEGFIAYTGKDEFFITYNGCSSKIAKRANQILDEIQNYPWREIHEGLKITATSAYSERGAKAVEIEIYFDERFSFAKEKEDIHTWITRTIWGVKNGKLQGKNCVEKSSKDVPEIIKEELHLHYFHAYCS